MSDVSAEPPKAGSKPLWGLAGWLGVVLLLLLGLAILVRSLTPSLPTYAGKRVDDWFEQAVRMTSTEYSESARRAFEEMEEEAIPFLVRWVNARYTPFGKAYAWVRAHLPDRLRGALPRPRTYQDFQDRRVRALILIREIAAAQRWKPGNGKSIAPLVLSAICSALRDPSGEVRGAAADAVGLLGPQAAPTISDLIQLTQDANERPACAAIMALGLVGPAASNAVPVLIWNAAHATGIKRLLAVQSLGEIGSPAQSAAPVLVSILLTNDNTIPANADGGEGLRVKAARALAEIGSTPGDAVPTLMAMTKGTNQWARWFASIALWNRDRQNASLQAQVIEGLRSTNRLGVLMSLGSLGTNAVAFIPEIHRLTNDPFARHMARRTLQRIQGSVP
ncbi:MAG: HEAT repeat domain-containing protein [Verrucomicrobia bacterium]|nr:HEAT repeat domain-containing protein [Verrucomicrobiota bacterium]